MLKWLKRKIDLSWFRVRNLTATAIYISPHDDYGLLIKFICEEGKEVNIRFSPKTTRRFCDEIIKHAKPLKPWDTP